MPIKQFTAESIVKFSPLTGYEITSIDPNGVYFGYTNREGAWCIKKIDADRVLYAKGEADYLSAWQNKETQVYDYFYNTFVVGG